MFIGGKNTVIRIDLAQAYELLAKAVIAIGALGIIFSLVGALGSHQITKENQHEGYQGTGDFGPATKLMIWVMCIIVIALICINIGPPI